MASTAKFRAPVPIHMCVCVSECEIRRFSDAAEIIDGWKDNFSPRGPGWVTAVKPSNSHSRELDCRFPARARGPLREGEGVSEGE